MNPTQTIAIDAMSGDGGPAVTLEACARFKRDKPHVDLLLIGREDVLNAEISTLASESKELLAGCQIIDATEVVEMDDSASRALRSKKDSSMRVAINCVKDGRAAACVSAGNTGALLAISKFVLKTLPGIARPAISTTIPSVGGHTHMLDLGANVDCTAEQLFQFAVMGAVLSGAVDSRANPRIGLLNIGSEDIKGNEQVKEAAKLLDSLKSSSDFNYIGFVEGNEIYQEHVDVVVCDGFVGNVSLKTSEGVAKMISVFMKEEFMRNPLTRIAGLVARPVLKSFGRRIDPRRYNGASLLGLKGVVIKSHGSADATAYANAIDHASVEIEKNVPARIGEQINAFLSLTQANENDAVNEAGNHTGDGEGKGIGIDTATGSTESAEFLK